MREILFRGKRIDNGEWVEGYLVPITINCYDKGYEIIESDGIEYDELDGYNPLFSSFRVDPATIGQYTGLQDKNGKRIFEGDIVKAVSPDCTGSMFIGPVLFKAGCYCIKYERLPELRKICPQENPSYSFHRIGEVERWQDMGASGNITYKYKAIGNIHDNPELWPV